MLACPFPLRVVEREEIVPAARPDGYNAAGLPLTVAMRDDSLSRPMLKLPLL